MKVRTVNVHEAKTHLSRLLARVARGEEIVIAKAGKPIARLVPAEKPRTMAAAFDLYKGQLSIAPDFDAPLPEDVLADFEGRDAGPA
ncbi:MAG: type II toxin-antitoxin system Phd/YefM family antitoxin [Candidatus Rokuibacteriota bacterium]